MEKMIVGIAEGKIALEGQYLVSYALGSCVGICLYDKQKKIAGMAHIVLPDKTGIREQGNPYKFAEDGVLALIRAMKRHGADEKRLTAKMAGGARMFATQSNKWEIGDKNVEAVRAVLKREHIKILGEDTGKDYGRTILFYGDDGRLEVTTVRHAKKVL